ncbi:MAG: hypothetical protein KDE10_10625, partial [Rhodobacteraceae bacterium]|nr:hypothetical protein [Paracoccaceae bacterium]
PEYSGMTGDGTSFLMRAGVARPLSEGGGEAEDVTTELRTPRGLDVSMRAGMGKIDPASATMRLSGGVSIETSTGYTITATGLVASTAQTEVVSDGAVTANAPFGTLDAGSMTLTSASDDPAAYVLVFNQGVKLIYDPKN